MRCPLALETRTRPWRSPGPDGRVRRSARLSLPSLARGGEHHVAVHAAEAARIYRRLRNVIAFNELALGPVRETGFALHRVDRRLDEGRHLVGVRDHHDVARVELDRRGAHP